MRPPRLLTEAATMLGGNVAAQAITLVAYFVVTRLYSPDDFGLFNVLFSYVEVLIILSTCKYEQSIIPQRHDTDALLLARFAMRLNALVSALLLAVAGLLVWLAGGRLSALCMLIPPVVFFSGTTRVYNSLLNRLRRYRPIAAGATLGATATAAAKILLALAGMSRSGLMLGTIGGQASGNLLLRHQVGKVFPSARLPLLDPRFTPRERALARRNVGYPLFVATRDFVNSFSSSLPFLWLGLHFDPAVVGLYALARTFTLQPANLVCGAFERVLYAHTAQRMGLGMPLGSVLRQFLLGAVGVGLPLAVAAYAWCGPVFDFCFGSRWAGCEPYVRALLPQLVATLAYSPLSSTANLFSRQRTEFGFFLVLLVLRVGALAAGIATGSFLLAIWLYSVSTAVVFAAVLVWYAMLVRRHDRALTAPSA